MLNNEEDIRVKLIMPFLNDLGFDFLEISLEDSFSISLGKSQKEIRGRSDILCKRSGKNLFILELKKEGHKINFKDVSQGISYARALVGNIAPFTIITNGKETKIYDTISEKEITGTKISEQSEFWKNGCVLATDQEMNIRYEALKRFVSFSDENLKVFCSDQVESRMKPIVGDIASTNSKYVESLQVQRQALNKVFKDFLDSEFSVFGLVGNAGVGKTCSMCSLALEAVSQNFVLFYNAAIIADSVIQTMASDLNLFFSSKSEKDVVLKKLDELARFINKKVVVFIDGIDENSSFNFSNELSEISYSIGKLKNIRLCISCKSSIWNRFLRTNGTNNHTYEELVKFHGISPSLEEPCYVLQDFNNNEISEILPIYRQAYSFKGEITDSVLRQLRNGFFLRIFSEVYSNKKVPKEINDIELINRYLVQALNKTPLGFDRNMRILAEIGKSLINHSFTDLQSFQQEGIGVYELLDDLKLPIDQEIPQGLFDRNILIKSSSNDTDTYKISFYYSKIRDYIICYHSFNLHKIDDDKFYNILEKFFENYVGQSAIYFFLQNAGYSKLNIYSQFKKDKLRSYAILYNNYLEEHFPKIKKEFDPKTNGKIGIVIPSDLVHKDGYALFPLNSDSNEIVHYDGFDQPLNTPVCDDRLFKKGVKSYYSSNAALMVSNQIEVVKSNVYKQLKKIVEEGLLYEYNSNIILMEKISSILYYNYKKLGYHFKIDDYYLPRFDEIYPINLIALKDKLHKFRAEHYYKRVAIEQNMISEMVEEAFQTKKEIPGLNVGGDFPPFEELFKIVNILTDRGFDIIESHHLPCPDISLNDVRNKYAGKRGIGLDEIKSGQFSNKQIKKYIKELFENIEIAYRQIVESCFPTLADRLTFYNNMPHEYIFYINDENNIRFGWYGYKKSLKGEFSVICKPPRNRENIFENDDDIKSFIGFNFNDFIRITTPLKTARSINSHDTDASCVVRNWTYQILIRDLNEIVKEYDIQIHRSIHY